MTNLLIYTIIVTTLATTASAQPGGFGENAPIQDFAQSKSVPHGVVKPETYFSKTYGTERQVRVYTPPNYKGSNTTYPVLYLIHGGGGNEATWSDGGKAQFILDNLVAAGNRSMIIVMPNGGGDGSPTRAGTPRPGTDSTTRNRSGQGAGFNNQDPQSLAERAKKSNATRDRFIEDLTTNIIPFIETNYRVDKGSVNRAIAGFSYGGAEALFAGVRYPAMFGWIGVFSMGIQGGSNANPGSVAGSGSSSTPDEFVNDHATFFSHKANINKEIKLFWIGSGLDDRVVANGPQQLSGTLTSQGILHEYHETPGGHDMLNWRQYLHDFALRLFK